MSDPLRDLPPDKWLDEDAIDDGEPEPEGFEDFLEV